MRKSDIVEKITAKQQSLSLNDVDLSVDHLLKYLANALSNQGRVEIRDFGNLNLHYQETRMAHNPRTGEKMEISGKYKVRFKMGKALKKQLSEAGSSS